MIRKEEAMAESTDKDFSLRRDKVTVVFCMATVTLIAWVYMIRMAFEMTEAGMSVSDPCMVDWSLRDFRMIFSMWSMMMVAMMLPTVAPIILIFSAVNRQRSNERNPLIPTGLFLLAYLFVWVAYSALATFAQWGLHASAILSHSMTINSPILGGAFFLAAGVFQWTPFRDACMSHCRSPIGFVLTEWREGKRGAMIMGLKHGTFCVGCCWMLMALSFVLGAMNMLWMAMLTIFMFLEKVIWPTNIWVSRIAGVALATWGLWIISRSLLLQP
jgi:predicted metal-binding membrane protein